MLQMTQEQFDAHQARVKGARTVKLMDGDPQKKSAAKPKPAEKAPRKKWSYEERLAQQLEDAGISGFFVDAEYIEGRGLRADILFPLHKLAVEVQGAVHRIKGKWQADIIKAQDTLLNGYRLLPIATHQVRDGSAVGVIRAVLDLKQQ